MTIKQAIADLRDAINKLVNERFNSVVPTGPRSDVTLCCVHEKNLDALIPAFTALESAVEGGTVDLTSRIEAAAEEIRSVACIVWDALPDGHWLKDVDDKLTAIIRRHLEVK